MDLVALAGPEGTEPHVGAPAAVADGRPLEVRHAPTRVDLAHEGGDVNAPVAEQQ